MAKARKRSWFVVRTNIKCEEKATRNMRAKGFRVYMPKMRKTIIHHRTKQPLNRYFKLFNRYLFVGIPTDDLAFGKVRGCEGVETILGIDIDHRPYEIARENVASIMRAQRRREFDDIAPFSKKLSAKKKFPIGSRLRVRTEHPFGGFYGQVIKIKGRGVVRATLELFGTLVPVDLQLEDIDAVYVDESAKAA